MDDRQLRRVREVLFKRLAAGEDPVGLQAQLTARLGSAEAVAFMAEARERVEARRSDPEFEEKLEAEDDPRGPIGPFWRGPILSRDHARRIVRNTAYAFAGMGGVWLVAALGNGQFRARVAGLLLALLFIGPAAVLWRSRSAVAAGAMVVISGLFGVLYVVVIVALSVSESSTLLVLLSLPFVALWLLLPLAALRALKATRFERSAAAAGAELAVFE